MVQLHHCIDRTKCNHECEHDIQLQIQEVAYSGVVMCTHYCCPGERANVENELQIKKLEWQARRS